MNTFRLNISSYEGTVFEEEVTMLILRGASGDLAIMAGHIPFATSVVPGEIRIMIDDAKELKAKTDGGLLTVDKDKTTLLSGSFQWVE
ncbi:MAG: F0F1 ATP synthase subunit epsilon [Ruminococcaceae bacterium]|nr:F0F1 ATP synthase subunit epsilon [Oscillospiraceae bacterium]